MSPRLASNQLKDRLAGQAVLAHQFGLSLARREAIPNLGHKRGGEAGTSRPFATGNPFGVGMAPVPLAGCRLPFDAGRQFYASHRSPFGVAVGGVVGSGAEKQMGGVDATAHVTPMQHTAASRDWPIRQFPRNAVRSQESLAARTGQTAVSVFQDAAGPQPTSGGLVDLRPEAFGQGLSIAKSGHVAIRNCTCYLPDERRVAVIG
jgi:hypothetical protein